ncbi:hypothetical protein ISN45_Aa08g000030 [Arabidopsis thaliana x Arabidopsis arenosa]|uniref:Arabidopsis retrotransposon Orf1 C-terminal domain-containing protein n=1 Tax=Arabidopsis thaliana x Arabidopsis arenosa TaxID=1240361 RepID=A0A8T1XEY8_9BRAS|nr:hypothetical protein ISN45_Aa08g000030 [Arabidopsis thaliana x Arabidopsis arenosa]
MAPRQRRSGKEPATGEREWSSTDHKNTTTLRTCKFEPTRFLDIDVLEAMGILDDVTAFLRNAGFGSFPAKRWPLFPDAAAELLATVELHYPTDPLDATDGFISFFLAKRPFDITLSQLCNLYAFPRREKTKFDGVTDASEFWQTFGSGDYVSRGAKQALIRNPVLRLAVRFISSTIFARAEMGTLQLPELSMCFYGLHPFITDPASANYNKTHRVNFAALLCQEFIQVRNNALRSSKKVITIGSMVTPIVAFCGFSVTRPLPENKARFIDREHLYASEILIRHSLVYRFQGQDGIYRYIRLPRIDLTSLAIPGNIGFYPPAGVLCERPILPKTSGVRRAARARQPDEAGPSEPPASQPPPFQTYSGQVPPFEIDLSAYTATEPPAEPSTEFERWVCDTTKKNNTLLTKITSWLCCVAPPPSPSPRMPIPPPSSVPEHAAGPSGEEPIGESIPAFRAADDEEDFPTWLSSPSHETSETSVQDDFRIRTRRGPGVFDSPPSP